MIFFRVNRDAGAHQPVMWQADFMQIIDGCNNLNSDRDQLIGIEGTVFG